MKKTNKRQGSQSASNVKLIAVISHADIRKAVNITLRQYSQTFKDLALYDRREKVLN